MTTQYDFDALKFYADRGASLANAVGHVAENNVSSLEEAIGLIIGCIACGCETLDEIEEIWRGTLTVYDEKTCAWLLDRFEGDDVATDLWMRGPGGKYTLLNSAFEQG